MDRRRQHPLSQLLAVAMDTGVPGRHDRVLGRSGEDQRGSWRVEGGIASAVALAVGLGVQQAVREAIELVRWHRMAQSQPDVEQQAKGNVQWDGCHQHAVVEAVDCDQPEVAWQELIGRVGADQEAEHRSRLVEVGKAGRCPVMGSGVSGCPGWAARTPASGGRGGGRHRCHGRSQGKGPQRAAVGPTGRG